MKKTHGKGELAIGAVCILLGFLLAVQLKSVYVNSAGDAATAGRLETLQELYNQAQTENETLRAQLEQTQSDLELYRDEAAQGGSYNEALRSEVDRLETMAGLTDLEGPGVEVVLRDSSAANATGSEADYIIHDSDLLSVVNELRDAGAEAIALNGERLLASSEIRCTGAVVTVNGRRYAAPYVITAIGDMDTLYSALTMRNGVAEILGQWGIEVTVSSRDLVTIPKYEGTVEFRYARPTATLPPEGEDGL